VEKARPRQAAEIAAFINRIRGGRHKLTGEDIMAAFGEKAFLFVKMEDRYVGLAGWQVENLVARTDDVYLESSVPVIDGMKVTYEGDREHLSRFAVRSVPIILAFPSFTPQRCLACTWI
jgi:hypothetical protein